MGSGKERKAKGGPVEYRDESWVGREKQATSATAAVDDAAQSADVLLQQQQQQLFALRPPTQRDVCIYIADLDDLQARSIPKRHIRFPRFPHIPVYVCRHLHIRHSNIVL